MAHRLSGAQKRARRNALKRVLSDEVQTTSSNEQDLVEISQRRHAPPRGSKQKRILLPTIEEVIAAVESLYVDESKPVGRLLRKRIVELDARARGTWDTATDINLSAGENQLPEVDMVQLRSLCEACGRFAVEPEEGGDWSVTLIGRQARFVDVYSTVDVYPEDMWAAAATYVEESGDDLALPGGRYSCAQALCARSLPFLQGFSLGQVCHIVQLAMTQKKILGYLSGAIVPYSRSLSKVKEHCAGQHKACDNSCQEAADLPCASWEQARHCMGIIVEEAASRDEREGLGVVPLSCVKRLFRTQFQLELSETVLGHSKLSELLQDAKFVDICSVRLDGHGYAVTLPIDVTSDSVLAEVECSPPLSPFCSAETKAVGPEEEDPQVHVQGFCENEPLCLEEVGEFHLHHDAVLFGPTPGPFGASPARTFGEDVWSNEHNCNTAYFHQFLSLFFEDGRQQQSSCDEDREFKVGQFCADEPLCFDDATDSFDEPIGFGPTPGPFGPTPGPINLPLAVFAYSPPADTATVVHPIDACSPVPLGDTASVSEEHDMAALSPEASVRSWSAPSPWKDGKMDELVQNTFIHVSFPLTPLAGTLRRAVSLGDLTDGTTSTNVTDGGGVSDASSATSPLVKKRLARRHEGPSAPGASESFSLDFCKSAEKRIDGKKSTGRRRAARKCAAADKGGIAFGNGERGRRTKPPMEPVDIVAGSVSRQIHCSEPSFSVRRRGSVRHGASK
eukprot:TRINITY_DN21_c0_g1_i2.p1 TRINITY_DN21_c0_g1~~TRINITY_DN21_c0_g1_i2.p1  ORF type:complete len:752 (+),score=121.06 TRINITY_DN21_c0_g1_i2:57-2258(+)